MNDKPILFSIVLPCYNRAAFLRSTIKSVQQQVYQNWELIIVNDGSTDETENIIDSIDDERIQYHSIKNSERGAARNCGIKKAIGDFICFLDSDDRLLTNHLSNGAAFISSHPQVTIFHQGYEIQNEQGKVLYSSNSLPQLLNKSLIRNNVISPNGIFLKREIIKQNLFREERELAGTEDYELWLRLSCETEILHHEPCTSVLTDHQQRSMKETDLQKLLSRINFFLTCVDQNAVLKNKLSGRLGEFQSWRYSYIALHASLSRQRKIALHYLAKSLRTWWLIIFTKRFYMIIYRLLIADNG